MKISNDTPDIKCIVYTLFSITVTRILFRGAASKYVGIHCMIG